MAGIAFCLWRKRSVTKGSVIVFDAEELKRFLELSPRRRPLASLTQ